ncbi:hypothetical protein [Sandaracinus amylolyticus]|uniref:hypothetical protein n=1 Tax=Sandaracinus amylolyticus TaxID=927083 RepID=UPI001F4321E5|nr:hypothetical protein [Sandaracinus amylolyticus]UJR82499.1 Hypothetical protein I5071_45640 [Sandaracinus amylolyticus]
MRWQLSLLSIVLGGCSVVNATSDHRDPIPSSEFCSVFAEVACRGLVECCPSAAGVDFEACLGPAAAQCAQDFGTLAADPRTGYDADAAARVAAEGNALVDTCSLALSDWILQRTGFQSVLAGTVPGGERCDAPTIDDVAPIFSCERDDQSCVYDGTAWECSARRAQGERCLLTWDCQDGLYCAGVFGTGTCEPRQADGSLCVNDEACSSLVCRTGRCVPRTVEDVYCGMDE